MNFLPAPCFGALLSGIWRLSNLIIQCIGSSGFRYDYYYIIIVVVVAPEQKQWSCGVLTTLVRLRVFRKPTPLILLVPGSSASLRSCLVSKQCCRIEQPEVKECLDTSVAAVEHKGTGWFFRSDGIFIPLGSLAPAFSCARLVPCLAPCERIMAACIEKKRDSHSCRVNTCLQRQFNHLWERNWIRRTRRPVLVCRFWCR